MWGRKNVRHEFFLVFFVKLVVKSEDFIVDEVVGCFL